MLKSALKRLQVYLAEESLDCLVVTDLTNVRYISGFSGSNGVLLVTPINCFLYTDFRYKEQCQREINSQVEPIIDIFPGDCGKNFIIENVKTIAFEGNYISANQFVRYQKLFPNKLLRLIDIDHLRMVKQPQEIDKMKQAVSIANEAFILLMKNIKIGISEIQIAAELEFHMKNLGSENPAFSTIVASGINSALPHAKPTDKQLQYGDFVIIDFGAVYQGYCSDMTRTLVMGKANEQQHKIYNLALDAQIKSANMVAPGISCLDVDACARDIICHGNCGDFFGHGLGHGVGLKVHESPRLSQLSKEILEKGMAVTVEPGIYIPNWGGVRIEDLLIVTESGSDILTASISKELLEIY